MIAVQLWPPRATIIRGTIEAHRKTLDLQAAMTRRSLAVHRAHVAAGELGAMRRNARETTPCQ